MPIIDIKTEITGNVWKIEAKIGQSLSEDEPIMILESMKMEIPVASSEGGTLVEILVEEGTIVARVEV
jgi:acetyl-CoA carboxylase biotin carboxyl carrier protein